MGKITIPLLVVDFLLNFSCSLSGYPSCQNFSLPHTRKVSFVLVLWIRLSVIHVVHALFYFIFFFAFLNFANHGPFFAPI